MKSLIIITVILLLTLSVCYGSSGDSQPEYMYCVEQCIKVKKLSDLPIYLRLLKWTVRQDCGYECMQKITKFAIEYNLKIHQYHGKWPFYRLFGIQEPASVLFSILNGLMHFKYYNIIPKKISNDYYLKKFYLGISIVGMNAWLWSTVFHTRDTPLTEKLDYFSAGLYILWGLYIAMIRIFYLRGYIVWIWTFICGALYICHVTYLSSSDRFDYGYNMLACIIVGTLQTSSWLLWSLKQYTSFGKVERRPFAWMVGTCVVLISLAMSLEVLDFPPLFGTLDAHSLWHAATIPLAPLFYKFLLRDTELEMKSSVKDKKL